MKKQEVVEIKRVEQECFKWGDRMNDLISRQAAIDAVIAEGRNVDSRYLESERIIHESDAVEAISMLPSAQQWIPCSERLPEWWWENYQGEVVWNSKPVIVCGTEINYPHSGMAVGLYGPDGWEIEDDGFAVNDTPIAWMPLPEPYRKTDPQESEGE